MIIVLKQDAPDVQVHEFCRELEGMGLQINDSKGSDTHILGLIGDTKAIAESWVLANPVVETCRRVSEPYKKANRKFHPDDSVIDVSGVKIGGGNFAVIAGPCSIESEEQITYCAQRVKDAGASLLRGGAFKPRMTLPAIPTSPLWCMTTPFEDPVVPVVKSSIDLSSSPGSSSSASLSSFILVIISFWLIHFIPSTGLSDMRHAASTLWPISIALSADVDFSIGTTSTCMYCSAVNTVR